MTIQSIYPIRPHTFRHEELTRTEQLLDKWYIELPEHLRFDPSSPKYLSQPPHVLTLHMQYWCTVLLLHRPLCVPCAIIAPRSHFSHLFSIRHLTNASSKGCVFSVIDCGFALMPPPAECRHLHASRKSARRPASITTCPSRPRTISLL